MAGAVDRESAVAEIAYRYASAGVEEWTDILARADANEVAIPVLKQLREVIDENGVQYADNPRLKEVTETGERAVEQSDIPSANETSASYVDAELRRRRGALETFALDLAHVHELLDGDGIEYAVIKTNVAYEYQPWDLNVLVSERNWPRVHELLVEAGWSQTTLRAHPLARLEPGKRLYEHDVRYPVHLHADVSWNGLTYLPASTILASRVRDDGVYYPDSYTDAVIHCAHSVFENFELTLGEALEISRVLGADREGGHELATEHGWPYGYTLAVETAEAIVSRIRRTPRAVPLPHEYDRLELLRAWFQHARRTDGGWYELPLNGMLSTLK